MKTDSLEFERSYILKFYLNARHYFTDGGYVGETHPHTWEFTLTIGVSGMRFVRFNVFEEGIDTYLEPYQNKVLNDEPPFDVVSPRWRTSSRSLLETSTPSSRRRAAPSCAWREARARRAPMRWT